MQKSPTKATFHPLLPLQLYPTTAIKDLYSDETALASG